MEAGLLILFDKDFWHFNVMELFASIAIVIALTRWWLEHRRNTLLGLKQVSNSWQGLDKQNKSCWLDVELKFSPRKSYQVSEFHLIIADRHCNAPDGKPFLPRKGEKRRVRFSVPNDITGHTNFAQITVFFAGTTFKTGMFQVMPMPCTSDKKGFQT